MGGAKTDGKYLMVFDKVLHLGRVSSNGFCYYSKH